MTLVFKWLAPKRGSIAECIFKQPLFGFLLDNHLWGAKHDRFSNFEAKTKVLLRVLRQVRLQALVQQ